MQRLFTLLLLLSFAFSCKKDDIVPTGRTEAEIAALCQTSSEFAAPLSLSVEFLTEVVFPGYIREFDFVTDRIGFASGTLSNGSFPAVLRTDDGGRTWEDTGLVGDATRTGFNFFDENFGIVSTYSREQTVLRQRRLLPLIWVTRDGGTTWEKNYINDRALDGRAGSVVFDSEGAAYLAIYQEGGGVIAKSEDKGRTWSHGFDLPNEAGQVQLINDEFYFGPSDNRVVRTDLSGNILGEISLPASNHQRAATILDENSLFVITDSLYRTTDGGLTWKGGAGGRGRILSFNAQGRGLVVMNRDFCPTDIGPSIDVLLDIRGGDIVDAGPQVANLENTISAAHVFSDGSALVGYRNKIFRLE